MEELFNPKRRELAKEYNSKQDFNNIVRFLLKSLFWVAILVFSWESLVYQQIEVVFNNFDLQLISFIGLFYLIYFAFSLIVDYYLSYRLSRSYGLSNQSSKQWLVDKVKVAIITLVFLYILARAFLTIISFFPQSWWIIFSIFGVVFIAVINFLFPIVLFPIFFDLEPYPDTELRQRLMRLFNRANVSVKDIYEFDLSSKTDAANAAVMGLGQTRKIILGDNLKNKYSEEEIEAVLAHEIGHHSNGDMLKLLGVQVFSLLVVTFLLAKSWPALVSFWGYESFAGIETLLLFILAFSALNWLVKPLELYLSRYFERQADDFALQFAKDPKSLATAFAKLADDSLSELELSTFKLLFKASHPPLGERIEKAYYYNK